MAMWLYNSVGLPELPDWWNEETHPYALISLPYLYFSTEPFVRNGDGSIITYGSGREYSQTSSVYAWNTWTSWNKSSNGKSVGYPDTVLWSNRDLLNEDGSVYLTASNPINTDSKLSITLIEPASSTVTVTFTCSNLLYTDAVYQVMAWVYPKGTHYLDAEFVYLTPAKFTGPLHTENYTFTDLASNTEYEIYAVIIGGDTGTEHNALATFTTGGAQSIYVGVAGLARRVRDIYLGIENVAHNVRKAYIGIGGVARPCWGGMGASDEGGVPTRYGTITPPNAGGNNAAAATVGGYAVFAGGDTNGRRFNSVSAYDENYTLHSPTTLRVARTSLAGVSPTGYALFVGGGLDSGYSDHADAYNEDLTRVIGDSLSVGRNSIMGATLNRYGFVNGGTNGNFAEDRHALTDVYDETLTRTAAPNARVDRAYHSGCNTANYAIFAGGSVARYGSGKTVLADAYDMDFTLHSAADMSVAKTNFTGTTAYGRVLFGGGYGPDGSVPINTVEVYSNNLTRTTVYLSASLMMTCGGSLGSYAVFVGGYNGSAFTTTVDIFDKNLNRTTGDPVSVKTNTYKSATVGDTLFFCSPSKITTEVFKLV